MAAQKRLPSPFRLRRGRLERTWDAETLWIEPWGEGLRIRATWSAQMPDDEGALLPPPPTAAAQFEVSGQTASVTHAGLTVRIGAQGTLSFFDDQGRLLLEEYDSRSAGGLRKSGREYVPHLGGDGALTARFHSDPDERLYGMGQYQQEQLNLKGCVLELAHRNCQCSIPVLLSSRGYLLLWNNPAIGQAALGRNVTEWTARTTKRLDYWITAAPKPADLLQRYAGVTGFAPRMPRFALGFWQSKLRYRSQDELLAVAREYRSRGLPLSVIVADFFHWTAQGDWKFDPRHWPDPRAMVAELRSLGVELAVSVWPNVDRQSENHAELLARGFLVRNDRGTRVTMTWPVDTSFFDATHPGARAFVWKRLKKNYRDLGVGVFWLDEAEPEYHSYVVDQFRLHAGPVLEVGNRYPLDFARTVADGLRADGETRPLSLIRAAWAGSQRHGALLWSGDIGSTWEALRRQVQIGLNVGLAGLPWWNSDIGGFWGGDPSDPGFRELLIRWFQWSTYCPVMRLHGDRLPYIPPRPGDSMHTGGANEVWSFGDEAYGILSRFLHVRQDLGPYLEGVMDEAHEKGLPALRALFVEFPDDAVAWTVEDQYLLGSELLVAPVLAAGARQRRLYLPEGASWTHQATGRAYAGGQWTTVDAPLESIPVFQRGPLS